MSVVLSARKLTTGYGSVPVVHGIDVEVGAGEVVALLGANGAGKTSTLLAVAGELPMIDGEVTLLGSRARGPLNRRARGGLAFVTEERSVFMGLSTAENLRLGGCDRARALELFPELRRRKGVRAGLLSGGEQQMLTLGRALARDPKVLLADELSLGLAPMVVMRLLEAVRAAADQQGMGVLLVEQHVRKALRFADRVYVMRRGRIELEGTARELRSNVEEIERQYLSSAAGARRHDS